MPATLPAIRRHIGSGFRFPSSSSSSWRAFHDARQRSAIEPRAASLAPTASAAWPGVSPASIFSSKEPFSTSDERGLAATLDLRSTPFAAASAQSTS